MNNSAASTGSALHASAHLPRAAATAARAGSSIAAATGVARAVGSIGAATGAARVGSSIAAMISTSTATTISKHIAKTSPTVSLVDNIAGKLPPRSASPVAAAVAASTRSVTSIAAATASQRAISSIAAMMSTTSTATTISKHIAKTSPTVSPVDKIASQLWTRSYVGSPAAAVLDASRWNTDSLISKLWNPNSTNGFNYRKFAPKSELWSEILSIITSTRHLAEIFADWFHRGAVVHGPYPLDENRRPLQGEDASRALALARDRLAAQSPPGQQATSRPQLVRGPTHRGVPQTSAESLIATAAA